jgi:hypothetical protein
LYGPGPDSRVMPFRRRADRAIRLEFDQNPHRSGRKPDRIGCERQPLCLGLYRSDNTVWKETPSNGGYVQSIVASGGLIQPSAIAVDRSGNVYLADLVAATAVSNAVVYKETLSNGSYTQSTVVTGPHRIYALATDAENNFYLSGVDNSDNYTVSKETLSGGNYTRSTVTNTGLTCPTALAMDGGGNVYVDDPCRGGNIFKETLSAGGYTQSTVLSNLPPTGWNSSEWE